MKKILALMLALLMAVCLTCCASKEPDSDSLTDSGADGSALSEIPAPDAGDEALPGDPVDYAWSTDPMLNVIPKPPFEGWETVESTNEVATLECVPGAAEAATFYDTCADYLETLSRAGFTETDNSKASLYKAVNGAGYGVEFQYGDGFCRITITVAPED